MIICAYHGVDKKAISRKFDKVIYLPVRALKQDISTSESAPIACARIAKALHDQGKIVIVDHDQTIRKNFRLWKVPYVIALPSASLEMDWIDMLIEQYREIRSDENLDILTTVVKNYKYDTSEMIQEERKILIESVQYDLWDGIHEALEYEQNDAASYTCFIGLNQPEEKDNS